MRTLILFAATAFSASAPLLAQTPIPARERTVVVISLDGFGAANLDDPELPIPTLRRLMKSGSWSRRMTTVNPTVTWPNHTSMVSGVLPAQHGLFYNGSLVRSDGNIAVNVDPSIEQRTMVHAPTVYDLAHKAGLTTAQVDWVAINRAPTITWEFPEVPSSTGPIEKEMIGRGLVEKDEVDRFRKMNILRRDQIWTDAATYILREHKPNLLLFHVLTLDTVQHTYGPKTLAATAAIAFLDSCVARTMDAIKASGREEQTTVLIVSDHGFKTVEKVIHPAVTLASANMAAKVSVVPEGGTAMLYLDREHKDDLAREVRKLFEGREGVALVSGPGEFAALGFPEPANDPQMADLVLVAKSGYAFAAGATGPELVTTGQKTGSHGYLSSDPDLDAIFIASGYGVKKGEVLERIRNIDVAPTIARLLGVKFDSTAGTAISRILN